MRDSDYGVFSEEDQEAEAIGDPRLIKENPRLTPQAQRLMKQERRRRRRWHDGE